jgi:quercetin dioxygenase-like cupin family protein
MSSLAQGSLAQVEQAYSRPDVHLGSSEAESPWIPLSDSSATENGAFLRMLSFDVRTNSFAVVLWVKGGGVIGRHRHRGTVDGYVLEGSWRYVEYDWVARAGDFIHESPGVIHTLVSDEGTKTVFFLSGPLEFYDDDGNHVLTHDVFYLIDLYLSYCREHGIPVNETLFL